MVTPTIKYYPQRFAGPTSSTDMNEFMKNALEDISVLSKAISEHNDKFDETKKILTKQFIYLQQHYQMLQMNYEVLDNQLAGYSNPSPYTTDVHLGYYDASRVSFGGFPSYPSIPETIRCSLDSRFGLLTPYEYSSVSRMYISDNITNSTYVPESMDNFKTSDKGNVLVRVKDTSYNSINIKSLSDAFDGSQDTYWYVEIKYPHPCNITTAELILDIPLPIETITSLDSNYIIVEPYPVFGTEIKKLYTTTDDKNSILSGSYNSTNNVGVTAWSGSIVNWVEVPLDNNVLYGQRKYDTKVTFPIRKIQGIRVHLKTDTYVVENGYRVFTLGARNIDCGYSKQTVGKALTKLELNGRNFKKIIDPSTLNTAENVSYSMYYENGYSDVSSYKFNKQLPVGVKAIYIETLMQPYTSMNGLNLRYEVY
jgi:hypothetical protein